MDPAVDGNLDAWTLSAAERDLSNARSDANRLDFALLLKFFQSAGRFPHATSAIGSALIAEVAQQLGVDPGTVGAMSARTTERARAEISSLCGLREATVNDAERLTEWLRDHIVVIAPRSHGSLVAAVEAECRGRRIEPPSAERSIVLFVQRCGRMRSAFSMPPSRASPRRAAYASMRSYSQTLPAMTSVLTTGDMMVTPTKRSRQKRRRHRREEPSSTSCAAMRDVRA